MRRVLLLFVVLPVLLYACVSTSPTPVQQAAMEETTEKLEDPKLPIDSLVTVGQLDNGLRYVIRQNQKPENRVELRLVVDAGSVLEDDNQQGLAHFAEHMAFNGTKNFAKQELVDYLELIGMRFGTGSQCLHQLRRDRVHADRAHRQHRSGGDGFPNLGGLGAPDQL